VSVGSAAGSLAKPGIGYTLGYMAAEYAANMGAGMVIAVLAD
jgi:hypothetical protein